jgi:hypothetical protein
MTIQRVFFKYFEEEFWGILVCKREMDVGFMPTSASMHMMWKNML